MICALYLSKKEESKIRTMFRLRERRCGSVVLGETEVKVSVAAVLGARESDDN